MKTQRLLRLSILCFYVLPVVSVAAVPTQPTGIAVTLDSSDSDWRYSTSIRETHLNRLSVLWYERYGNQWTGGIALRYLEGTQNDNPVSAARLASGNAFGIELYYHFYSSSHAALNLMLGYDYNELKHSQDTQQVELRWHQWRLGLESRLTLAADLALSMGVSTVHVDGEEVLTGPITQVTDFDANQGLMGNVGLQLNVDQTGYVGIEMTTGHSQGWAISFKRWF